MTSRFFSNLTVLLIGALLLVAALAFRTPTTGWVALGAGCLAALTVLAAFPVRGRGIVQRTFDVCMALGAAWTIVASRLFSGATLKWLTLANGVVFLVLAVIALVLHEAALELQLAELTKRHERAVRDRGTHGDGDVHRTAAALEQVRLRAR